MADETGTKRGLDAADAPSKTQDPQAKAEQPEGQPADPRLIPGGAHGAHVDPGMTSIDPDTVIGLGGQEDKR